MLVKQILKKIFIALVCVCCIFGATMAVETNEPLGDVVVVDILVLHGEGTDGECVGEVAADDEWRGEGES